MKFAHGVVSTFICCGIMMAIGVALSLLAVPIGEVRTLPGGYFIMMIGLFLMQLTFSVNIANMVQASPMKKRLQTSVPATMSTLCMVIGYLLTVLLEGIVAYMRPNRIGLLCEQLIFTVAMMGIFALYSSICYKYFFSATIMFVLVFGGCYGYLMGGGMSINFLGNTWATFVVTALVGLAVIPICGVLQYLLFLVVYKAPLSKRAQAASLRRQL